MKLVTLALLVFSTFSQVTFAGPEIFCSLKHAKRVVALARNHSTYDKNQHCSASCMLALKCNDREVLLVGYLKEFRDAMGYGTPEQDDIKADAFGISLSANGAATTDTQCLSQCDLYYRQ